MSPAQGTRRPSIEGPRPRWWICPNTFRQAQPADRSLKTVGQSKRIVGPLGRRTTWWGDLSRPVGPGWGNGWPVGPGVGLRCGGSPGVTPGAGTDRSFSWGGLSPVERDGCWCGSRRSGLNGSSSGPTGQPFSQPGSQALGASPPRSVRPNGPTVLRNRWGNADELLSRWGDAVWRGPAGDGCFPVSVVGTRAV